MSGAWKTTKIKRETLLRLRSVKQRFDFKSLDEVFTVFLMIRDKMRWDKADMYAMGKFGKLPEVISGEARNESQFDEKKAELTGPEFRKISEIPDVERIGKASIELLKDKKESEK
jgi:hypothetical protein